MRTTILAALIFAVALGAPSLIRADEPAADKARRIEQLERNLEEMTRALGTMQRELAALKAGPSAQTTEPPSLPAPGEKPSGHAPGLPFEFTLVGDFTASLSREGTRGQRASDRASFREAELMLGADLSPGTRGDVTLAFPDGEAPEVEEGYMTWLEPVSFLDRIQIGKLRSPFGKLNRLHRHDLPQTDYPRVIKHFFGDEGLADTGAMLSHTFDNPWNAFSQVTYMIGNGENETAFDNKARSEPMHLIRWTNFFGPDRESGLELGASKAYGVLDRRERNLVEYTGADLTYIWKRGKEKAFRLQNEAFWSQRQRFTTDLDVTDIPVGDSNERKFGFYSMAECQWAARWAGGIRYDHAQIPGSAVDNDREWALSPYLTFHPGEFMRLRLEFSHAERRGSESIDHRFLNRRANTFTLQGTFILGSECLHEH